MIISDAKVAQQLCVGQADKFSTRPPGLFLARVLKGKGMSSENQSQLLIIDSKVQQLIVVQRYRFQRRAVMEGASKLYHARV